MRNTYFENIKKISNEDRNTINNVYRAFLCASQQMFVEELKKSSGTEEYLVFPIAEGMLKYDISKHRGIFIPSENFKKLLQTGERSEVSNLLKKEVERFEALVQLAYSGFPTKKEQADAKKEDKAD